MAPHIASDGLNQLYDGGNEAKVDIVFVHGLRGHPKSTWEMIVDPADPTDVVFWPFDLLPTTIKESRIFSFGYHTEFATFYPIATPESISHTNIDNHSTGLITKLGDKRRDTNTSSRPIIFVAHSLGGLVTANGLARNYRLDKQSQEVVDNTCGAIFLGTPFKGSSKAAWAKMAEKVLGMFGDSNDKTIKDLDKRSEKLQNISFEFHKLLQQRYESKELKPIQVACFFEEKSMRKKLGAIKKDLGQIVTSESATLIGYNPVGINADHTSMCRFPDAETAGYIAVTGKIKLMIANLEKGKEDLRKNGQTVITFGNLTQGSNVRNIGGFIMGNVVGTTEKAVNFNLTNNWSESSAAGKALAN